MILNILLLVLGLVFTVLGADWLVDGASSIAKRLGVSDFVIGLTIVGFGTSCPELVVSLTGAFQGNADISVGNVIGSNVMNTLLILGFTALLYPIVVSDSNRKRDIPINLMAVLLFIAMGMNTTIFGIGNGDSIIRSEGFVFLVLFAGYMYYCFMSDNRESEAVSGEPEAVYGVWKSLLFTLLGLASLVFGGRVFVDSATSIARMIGVSDKFIAITVLAGGTSLPELVTCIVAAAKHKEQLALGNIIGSNVFNILLILGISAVVSPLSLSSMGIVDMLFLLGSALLLVIFTNFGDRTKVGRVQGALLLIAYAAYMIWLFSKL